MSRSEGLSPSWVHISRRYDVARCDTTQRDAATKTSREIHMGALYAHALIGGVADHRSHALVSLRGSSTAPISVNRATHALRTRSSRSRILPYHGKAIQSSAQDVPPSLRFPNVGFFRQSVMVGWLVAHLDQPIDRQLTPDAKRHKKPPPFFFHARCL